MSQNIALNQLRTPKDYISDGRTHIFPSEGSLQWFIRKNKNLLIESSALLCPTGRTLIDANHFDEVVYAVGTIYAFAIFNCFRIAFSSLRIRLDFLNLSSSALMLDSFWILDSFYFTF